MSAIKSIWMPVRRYLFLEDDEKFHRSDIMTLIGVSSITIITLLVCLFTVAGNY